MANITKDSIVQALQNDATAYERLTAVLGSENFETYLSNVYVYVENFKP